MTTVEITVADNADVTTGFLDQDIEMTITASSSGYGVGVYDSHGMAAVSQTFSIKVT